MKLGIIADSHDNLNTLRQAVDYFNQQAVKFVLHAGDFVAPFTLKLLEQLKCPYQGVFGNNDGEKEGLRQKSDNKIHPGPYYLELGGRKILLMHELDKSVIKKNIDLLIYGHTHKVKVGTENGVLLFNPGECGGWLTGKPTVAIIDLLTLDYEIKELGK